MSNQSNETTKRSDFSSDGDDPKKFASSSNNDEDPPTKNSRLKRNIRRDKRRSIDVKRTKKKLCTGRKKMKF